MQWSSGHHANVRCSDVLGHCAPPLTFQPSFRQLPSLTANLFSSEENQVWHCLNTTANLFSSEENQIWQSLNTTANLFSSEENQIWQSLKPVLTWIQLSTVLDYTLVECCEALLTVSHLSHTHKPPIGSRHSNAHLTYHVHVVEMHGIDKTSKANNWSRSTYC